MVPRKDSKPYFAARQESTRNIEMGLLWFVQYQGFVAKLMVGANGLEPVTQSR